MSLIPGIVGQQTTLTDGVKVDSISELTAGNGVQLQGRTSGAAIPSGSVGQVVALNTTNVTVGGAGSWFINISPLITLSPGSWLIFPSAVFAATTSSCVNLQISSGTTAGSGFIIGYNATIAPNNTYNSIPLIGVIPYNVGVAASLYAQAYFYGAYVSTVTFGGYAIRIA